jgi:hypothetical protein
LGLKKPSVVVSCFTRSDAALPTHNTHEAQFFYGVGRGRHRPTALANCIEGRQDRECGALLLDLLAWPGVYKLRNGYALYVATTLLRCECML